MAVTQTGVPNPELISHGITEKTPDRILLGAGTIFKNLTWDGSGKKWKFDSVLGATSGGSKFQIKPTYKDVAVDGAHVKVKGLTFKIKEVATLETSMAEVNPTIIKEAVNGKIQEAEGIEGYQEVVTKAALDDTDYMNNIAYVGRTTTGKPIIIIMGNALCTDGLQIEGKNEDASVIKLKFESYGDINGDLKTLPVKILYLKEWGGQ